MFNYELWYEHFKPRLNRSGHCDAFDIIARRISRLDRALIVEAGCIESLESWNTPYAGSTEVWNWMAGENTSGEVRVQSCAATPEQKILADKACKFVSIRLIPPPRVLEGADPITLSRISLLHIGPSCDTLESVGVLASAWKGLNKGAMVSIGVGGNQHLLVKAFMDQQHIRPDSEGQCFIWTKP